MLPFLLLRHLVVLAARRCGDFGHGWRARHGGGGPDAADEVADRLEVVERSIGQVDAVLHALQHLAVAE